MRIDQPWLAWPETPGFATIWPIVPPSAHHNTTRERAADACDAVRRRLQATART
jgi:hypothetical protein